MDLGHFSCQIKALRCKSSVDVVGRIVWLSGGIRKPPSHLLPCLHTTARAVLRAFCQLCWGCLRGGQHLVGSSPPLWVGGFIVVSEVPSLILQMLIRWWIWKNSQGEQSRWSRRIVCASPILYFPLSVLFSRAQFHCRDWKVSVVQPWKNEHVTRSAFHSPLENMA